MDKTTVTGGPAFPLFINECGEPGSSEIAVKHEGMTLRAYFAAKAMQGLLSRPESSWDKGDLAKDCLMYADELIAATCSEEIERERRMQAAEKDVLAGLVRFVGELSRVVAGDTEFAAKVEERGGDGLSSLMGEIERRLGVGNEEVGRG